MPKPELFVPVRERQPLGLGAMLWRLWIVVGVLMVGPLTLMAIAGPERDAFREMAITAALLWLLVTWIVRPTLFKPRDQR